MQLPVKITYRGLEKSEKIDNLVLDYAARLEKLTGRLHRTIVASEGFAGICAGGWTELGEFPIAGFSKAERVYGLMDESPAP